MLSHFRLYYCIQFYQLLYIINDPVNRFCLFCSNGRHKISAQFQVAGNESNSQRKFTEDYLLILFYFLNTIFVSNHMYPENPEGTQIIVGSMNMGYISDTARNRTHNLFRPKREPIPLGHSDGQTEFNSASADADS